MARPMRLSTEKTVFPVERLAVKKVVSQFEIENVRNASSLWLLQQAIFEAKMSALNEAIDAGKIGCKPARVTIQIIIEQDVIPDSATDGKVIELPENLYHFTTYSESKEWLPWLSE